MRLAWIPVALLFGALALAAGCTDGVNTDPTDQDGDGVLSDLDCDDDDATRFPGNPERCDGIDNDCNGRIDDQAVDAPEWYRDVDGDGYGDEDIHVRGCSPPDGGFVDNGDDCNDLFSNSYPGADEICDGNDNDCDEDVDEDAIDAPTWYRDSDDDGFGTDTDTVDACGPPVGYVGGPGDCDDDDDATYPRAPETCDDKDNDCDGKIDEEAIDAPAQWPDADRDGHGSPDGPAIQACTPPPGYASIDDDCDDTEPTVFPGSIEICDGLDNDCSNITREDGLVTADGANVSDIPTATSAAMDGGVVAVCSGTWPVSLTIAKDLELRAPQGADRTFLEPSTADVSILTIESGAAVSVSGFTFRNGDAAMGGAIDATAGGDLNLRDAVFTNNTATDGGAIAVDLASTTSITNCTFDGNLATDRGGAIVVGEVTIENTLFTGNTATTGGAIYVDGGSANLDEDTLIEKNTAEDGGGIAIKGANGVTSGFITDNEADRDGGGVWLDDGGWIVSSQVDLNTAGRAGGGVLAAGAATLETMFLFDNTAARGGGVASTGGTIDVTASEVSRNLATEDGGGMIVLGGSTVIVTGSIVTANEATRGGGAWVEDGTLESSGADWGTSSLDNDPDDVAITGGSAYDSYGSSATFTCTSAGGSCS